MLEISGWYSFLWHVGLAKFATTNLTIKHTGNTVSFDPSTNAQWRHTIGMNEMNRRPHRQQASTLLVPRAPVPSIWAGPGWRQRSATDADTGPKHSRYVTYCDLPWAGSPCKLASSIEKPFVPGATRKTTSRFPARVVRPTGVNSFCDGDETGSALFFLPFFTLLDRRAHCRVRQLGHPNPRECGKTMRWKPITDRAKAVETRRPC